MKKLKLDKNFKPLPIEEGEEFKPNGYFEFNVTKMLKFIRSNPDKFLIEKVIVDGLQTCVSDELDESTIQKSDLSNPIVLAEISPERFNVIDGNHRLEKARREGNEKIPAYRIGPDHHVAFLTAEKSYKAYVEYWNEKVDVLSSR